MTGCRTRGGLLPAALVGLCLAGCIVVPADIRADFAAPDGKRPNNFGRLVEQEDGRAVEPDRPTIPPVEQRDTR